MSPSPMPVKRVVFEVIGGSSPQAFATTDLDHRQVVALNLWNRTHGGLSGRAASTPEEAYSYEVISRFEDDNEIQILLHEISRGNCENIPGAKKAAIVTCWQRISSLCPRHLVSPLRDAAVRKRRGGVVPPSAGRRDGLSKDHAR